MDAIRQIIKPIDNKITIELPKEFYNETEVEVIVLPSDIDKNNLKEKKSRKNALGKYQGQIWMSPDFNSPIDDFKEYME